MTTALFLLDTVLNALALMIAQRLAGNRGRLWRVLAGAAFGALIGTLSRRLPLSRGQTVCLWLPTAMAMMVLACGRMACAHPVRYAMLLLCAAGLLGGVVLSLYGATGSLVTAYALGGVCTIVMAANVQKTRRTVQNVHRVRVICRYRGQTAAFDAMVDSGNTLQDYLTHLPVIVMPEETGRRCFHLGDAVLRPIFADTAGGRQMMGMLAPQETIVEAGGAAQRVSAVVALSPAMNKHVPALVPASLLEESEEEET